MVKHFCDACKKECNPIIVALPTMSRKGFIQHNQGNRLCHRDHVSIRHFDLCDDCYGVIAENIYSMTKIWTSDK